MCGGGRGGSRGGGRRGGGRWSSGWLAGGQRGGGWGRGRTLIPLLAAIDPYLVVIADLKRSVSKLVFFFANEPDGDIALSLLAQRLPAEEGLHGRPALNVLGGPADTVERLSVPAVTVGTGMVVVDPVGPGAAVN